MIAKRYFKLLLVLVVISMVLTACTMPVATPAAQAPAAQAPAGDQPLAGTKITVLLRSLPETDFIVSKLDEFKAKTGIDVELATFPEEQLRDKQVQDLSSGACQFDVMVIDSVFVPEFSAAGWLLPLDDLLIEEYNVSDLPEAVRGLLSRDGKLYGLPVYAEITHLMYRKDVFEKLGLKVPTTFEELEAAAKAIQESEEGMSGLAYRGLRGNGMNVYIWSQWLRSYGGEYLDENSNPIFNNEAGVKATEEYARLLQTYGPEGVANFSWDDVQTAFTSGKAGMIIDANNFYTRIEDPERSEIAGKIGYANVPAGPAGQFPGNYTMGFGISGCGPQTDAEKQAAAEFIMWATSAEMQEASVDAKIVSQTRTSVLSSDKFKEAFAQDWLNSTIESWAMTDPNYRPLFSGWRTMGDTIGIAVQDVIAGTKDAKTAMDEAAAQVTQDFEQLELLDKPRPY